ncbi:MAG: hypothetical protein LBK59_07695, partial [Bifidobacteriaceae bacterium]|nr:hypothetical protein [Bifidobacteriaceae bacterium]
MSTPVPMPGLGESVTEATVTRWLKTVGDHVAVDEPLVEVSTDKVDAEIPSPVAGTLASIAAGEDQVVQVGAILAHIAADVAGSPPPQRGSPAYPAPPDQTVPFAPVVAPAAGAAPHPSFPLPPVAARAGLPAEGPMSPVVPGMPGLGEGSVGPHVPSVSASLRSAGSSPLTPSWLPIPDAAESGSGSGAPPAPAS